MTVWHVSARWHGFHPDDGAEVHYVEIPDDAAPLDLDTRDALSEPEVDALMPAALALWPRGAAWGAPGMEAPGETTVLAGLTRALLAPFAALYRRAWQLTLESRAASLVESLADWEADHGLPDPCATEPQTVEQRMAGLRARVLRLATITPADIVVLAARLGFTVAVEEPEPFRVGETPLGWGELSNVALGQQWVIHIHDVPATRFEVGVSEVGVDRLLDFDIGIIACAIRRVAPGWTMPIFSVAPPPQAFRLITEDGLTMTDDDGVPILVVLPAPD